MKKTSVICSANRHDLFFFIYLAGGAYLFRSDRGLGHGDLPDSGNALRRRKVCDPKKVSG
jgi:hypothetical protein